MDLMSSIPFDYLYHLFDQSEVQSGLSEQEAVQQQSFLNLRLVLSKIK